MSVKVFVGSVLVSILVLAPATFLLMPVIYPSMNAGTVLQSEYYLFDSEARIYDYELSSVMMDSTSCLVETQGGSSLTILFTAVGVMSLNSAWREKSEYIVDVVVESVGNRAILHAFHDDGPAHGAYRVITFDITINLDTGILTAGTYNVSVYWRSTFDGIGTNTFSIYDPGNDYLRSLWIQEIYRG
ncbi:MAG: hypothetical protein ACTSQ4_11710 [Candidatus Heimdallarchaeaceae archaeon]